MIFLLPRPFCLLAELCFYSTGGVFGFICAAGFFLSYLSPAARLFLALRKPQTQL